MPGRKKAEFDGLFLLERVDSGGAASTILGVIGGFFLIVALGLGLLVTAKPATYSHKIFPAVLQKAGVSQFIAEDKMPTAGGEERLREQHTSTAKWPTKTSDIALPNDREIYVQALKNYRKTLIILRNIAKENS